MKPHLEKRSFTLAGHRTSKGTVHFAPDAPLSGEIVSTLVRARIAELGG